MKAFAGATTFYAIALLSHQQPKSKPFNPPLIFIPKLSVSFPPPYSSSAIRKWACSHYSRRKAFKVKAKTKTGAEADKDDEKKLVRVKILLQQECMFGEQFSVVGTGEGLGSWDPQAAIPMNWSPGHLWTTPLLDVPVGKRIYFKFILTDKLGEIQWQPGPDRIFETWETTATIVVSEDWDSFHPQTVTEEATEDEFDETKAETQDPIGGGTAEVLVPGTDEGGGGEVISGVPVLVPGLTKAFHGDCSVEEDVGSDRNSLVSVMVAGPNAQKEEEEEEEEEEDSSYVEDAVDTPTNHRSLVLEEEEEEEEEDSSYVEDAVDTPTNHRSLVLEEEEEEENSSYFEDAVDTLTNNRSLVHEEAKTSSSAEMSVASEEEASIATELIENGDHAASSELNCNEGEHLNSGNGQSDTSVLQNDFDWGRKALSKLIWSLGLKDQ